MEGMEAMEAAMTAMEARMEAMEEAMEAGMEPTTVAPREQRAESQRHTDLRPDARIFHLPHIISTLS